MPFPSDFVWGVSSASYQVEGAVDRDGRGPSIWDDFSAWPGKTHAGQTGAHGSGSYDRVEEDAELVGGLGAKGYRFSVAWPRVMPEGVGPINERGLDYYERLVDALLQHGVEPWVTLYHWDLPTALHRRGGWLNRDCAGWFADYAGAAVERLSDRVLHWMTLNEPQIFLGLGYENGTHAPGLKLSRKEVLLASHHALLAHGNAVRAIRAHSKDDARVGCAMTGQVYVPATDSPADIEAARKLMFSVPEENWTYCLPWLCDPMILGTYPQDGLEQFGEDAPAWTDADMAAICEPLDFFGVNIYHGEVVRAAEGRVQRVTRRDGYPITMFRWPVQPESLYWGPKLLQERYRLPIVITENGLASMDWIHADGKVHDPGRIDFLARYLNELERTIDDGVDVRGYFQWSIMDNYEWAEGYEVRFGLVYLDYRTFARLPKDSYHWYAQVIESNGRTLPKDPAPL